MLFSWQPDPHSPRKIIGVESELCWMKYMSQMPHQLPPALPACTIGELGSSTEGRSKHFPELILTRTISLSF